MTLTKADAGHLEPRLLALSAEALGYVSPARIEATVRRWLGRVRAGAGDTAWDQARTFAEEVALITPSLLGATPFDHLADAMRHRPAHDRIAADLLRRSRPRLLRRTGAGWEDMGAGGRVTLAPPRAGPPDVLFGRFAALEDGALVGAGPLVTLPPDALATARAAIGTAGSIERGAEAVYRHLIQHAGVAKPERPPFDPAHDLIDRLAAAWAALDRDPLPSEHTRARTLAGPDTLLEALRRVSVASDRGLTTLARAYRWIAAIMVETMALRGANGSVRMSLDAVAATLSARIARGDIPAETQGLFETLRAGVRRTAPPAARPDTDLDKLVQRIQGLRAKTVEQGCTEQEALAAAEKVAELLDRYGLSLSELDLRRQACEGIGIETGRKRRGPIDDCMTTIAAFFDCRVWAETGEDGTLRYVFFGLPADVQAAVYLHDLIVLAFASETASFQSGAIYLRTATSGRRTATTSFQAGLAQGIVGKLTALHRARQSVVTPNGTARSLVPVKQAIIDEEMQRLGLNLRSRGAARRTVLRDAYGAGQAAGERFEYRPGIGAEA